MEMNTVRASLRSTGVDPVQATTLVEGCDTPARLFRRRVDQWDQRPALRYKSHGVWKTVTWRNYHERVRSVAMALAGQGLERGDAIAVLAGNRPEWLYADLGAQCLGVIGAGIYPTSSPEQCQHILADCGARVVVVENGEQLEKVLTVRDRCPKLERIVVMDDTGIDGLDDADATVMRFNDWLERGRELHRQSPSSFDQAIDQARPHDVAFLVYTSGTTGAPKGAMIRNASVVFQIGAAPGMCTLRPGDHTLSFLPLCHIAERMTTVFNHLAFGNIVHFPESAETVLTDLPEVAPHLVFAPPRFWEKMHSQITLRMQDAVLPAQWMYRQTLALGSRVTALRLRGEPVPWTLAWRLAVLRPIVFGNIRRLLGLSRARDAITGAAPVPSALIEWFLILGIELREAYGMTETCGFATATLPDRVQLGCAGVAVAGTELRCGAEGEILVRGPNVFGGYLGLPQASAQAIDAEGWLHTGDVGVLDEQGNVRILDRLKDILITSGGKNVTPSVIESQLRLSPYIADAVVVGDGRHFLSCLVMPDEENLVRYAQEKQIPYTDFASLVNAQSVGELMDVEINKVNSTLARVEQVKAFRLIDRLLMPEDDELTPTMKLKRRVLARKYEALIDSMYAA